MVPEGAVVASTSVLRLQNCPDSLRRCIWEFYRLRFCLISSFLAWFCSGPGRWHTGTDHSPSVGVSDFVAKSATEGASFPSHRRKQVLDGLDGVPHRWGCFNLVKGNWVPAKCFYNVQLCQLFFRNSCVFCLQSESTVGIKILGLHLASL